MYASQHRRLRLFGNELAHILWIWAPNSSVTNKNASIFGYVTLRIWPHRLTVRTPGSHPGNPGSIPGEVTIEKVQAFIS